MKMQLQKFSLMTLASLGALLISASPAAHAIDPKNPVSTCDRFAGDADKAQCEKQMKTEKPDWYLAGICSKQFDDKSFYECVGLGKTAKFSPEKLQNCDNTTASDETRLSCLKEIAQVGSNSDEYQGRKPADDRRWEKGYAKTKHAR